MAIDKVKAYFAEFGREGDVMEFPTSSATVELAAQAVGCEPARIAKTLSFAVGDRVALVVCAGDARIANPKFKAQFGTKPRMLPAEEAEERVGHAVGGVCPFAVNEDCDVYLDESLRRFDVPGLRQLQQRHRPRSRRAGRLHTGQHLGRRLQVAGGSCGVEFRCRSTSKHLATPRHGFDSGQGIQ